MDDQVFRLQRIELDILKKVLALCEKYGLVYYALGGTLLGAVRHKGFIPWDDDIDIGMPRPDYERFLEVAAKELEMPYQLHTLQQKNGEYSYYYARVENTDVKIRRKATIKEVVIPAWIDVFPLDGVPDRESQRKWWKRKCSFLKKLFKASQFSYFCAADELGEKRSKTEELAKKIIRTFGLENWISTERSWKALDRSLKKFRYEDCSSLINFCGCWGFREMFPKSVYGKGRFYPFEDILLNGPEDYDFVLTQMYGEYMTPPPESERDHHHIELLG